MRAFKIFESLNFERGQDPKDSMNIGRVWERKVKAVKDKMKTAMKILAFESNALLVWDDVSRTPIGYISYEFTKEKYTYFLLYTYTLIGKNQNEKFVSGYQVKDTANIKELEEVDSIELGMFQLRKWLKQNES